MQTMTYAKMKAARPAKATSMEPWTAEAPEVVYWVGVAVAAGALKRESVQWETKLFNRLYLRGVVGV
jgi:hypothetical protein